MATQSEYKKRKSHGNPHCSKPDHTRTFIGTDGFERCKDCRREYYRKWISNPINQAKHAHKQQARILANKHKASLKKDSCENCGSKERLHMHHFDYAEPLKVITLCVWCHEALHHNRLELPSHD